MQVLSVSANNLDKLGSAIDELAGPTVRNTGISQVLPSFRVRCDEGPHAPRDLGSGAAKATTRPASSACIGPVLGFRIAGARHYFHSHLYSPSGSWPRMPRIVALPREHGIISTPIYIPP